MAPPEGSDGYDENTNWFAGFEEELGVTVSAQMARKLKKDRLALQRKIEQMTAIASTPR